jgi:uncharacterized protein (TIGR02596 family)
MKRRNSNNAKAFSLVELLVVVAIMGALFLIAMPVVNSLLDANNVSRGGQMVADLVNQARQTASSRNRAVELRLIKVPSRSAKGYSAAQLWMTDATGQSREYDRAVQLPQTVVVAETSQLSQALPLMSKGTMPSTVAVGGGQDYVAFQVRPNGLVTPAQEMKNCYVSVVSIRSADATSFPNNFAMVQVNPLTATPLVYRP